MFKYLKLLIIEITSTQDILNCQVIIQLLRKALTQLIALGL